MMSRGVLIAVEGCDGAGTTTQAGRLADSIAHVVARSPLNPAVHLTRQPSDGPVGRMIREILAGGHRCGAEAPDAVTIALLFAADRTDHQQREVWPALDAGQVVVSDRWYHSSFAYNVAPETISGHACLQNGLHQNGWWIRELNAFARRPDVTFFLDVDPEVAAERRAAARRSTELYDDLETQRAVVDRYRRLYLEESRDSKRMHGEIIRIDGHLPPDDIAARLFDLSMAIIGAKKGGELAGDVPA